MIVETIVGEEQIAGQFDNSGAETIRRALHERPSTPRAKESIKVLRVLNVRCTQNQTRYL